MARARNIKPSFFTNDELVELEPIYRLLFIGLWVLADREGRLENRPKKIKMELFPADNVDIESGLSALQKTGFISLYNCYETNVIQINNFAKHQAPHGLEKDSDLPNEDGTYTTYKRNQNKTVNGSPIFISREQWLDSKGLTEKKPSKFRQLSEETVKNSSETVVKQDRNALNPDSLNPDSLNLIPEDSSSDVVENVPPQPKFVFKTELKKAGVSEEAATEFMQVRKAKKAVNTKNAFEKLLEESQKANLSLPQAIDFCLKRQKPWGAFMATWYQNEQQQAQQAYHSQSQANSWAEYNQRVGEQFSQNELVDVTPKKSVLIEEVGHA